MAASEDEVGLNRTPLTIKQGIAARRVAEDELSDEKIAESVGIAKSTLELWKKRPDFIAAVAEHIEAFKNLALTEGFADKRERLRVLNMLGGAVLTELAKLNGMYREEVKIAANGEHVSYQVFDKPKHDTLRGYLDDIASEMGERGTNVNLSGDPDRPLVLSILGVDVDEV